MMTRRTNSAGVIPAPGTPAAIDRLKSTISYLLFAAPTLVGLASHAMAADTQVPDDNALYIQGPENVEDLIHIRGTDWILGGRLGSNPAVSGGLYLINKSDFGFHEISPDFSGAADEIYGECPGAPDPQQFMTHGLSIRYEQSGKHELYAINHGQREAVEIFDLDTGPEKPRLSWKGCVITPEAVSANGVTHLPNHGFAVTSFGIKSDKDTYQKMMAGEPSGLVAEWSPSTGWSQMPGTFLSGTNGIMANETGDTLYVTGWGDQTLNVISRGKIPYTRQTIALENFHPDNIRLAPDGNLIITGQAATPQEIFGCGTKQICDVGWKTIKVDPGSYAVEQLLHQPGTATFGGASVAIIIDDTLWVGTFRGDRIARFKMHD